MTEAEYKTVLLESHQNQTKWRAIKSTQKYMAQLKCPVDIAEGERIVNLYWHNSTNIYVEATLGHIVQQVKYKHSPPKRKYIEQRNDK